MLVHKFPITSLSERKRSEAELRVVICVWQRPAALPERLARYEDAIHGSSPATLEQAKGDVPSHLAQWLFCVVAGSAVPSSTTAPAAVPALCSLHVLFHRGAPARSAYVALLRIFAPWNSGNLLLKDGTHREDAESAVHDSMMDEVA